MSLPQAEKPLFPIGVTSFAPREPGEMAVRVREVGWEGHYTAVGPQGFQTDLAVAQTPGCQLARVHHRTPSISRGEGPRGAYVLALTRHEGGLDRLGGERLGTGNLGLIRPEREFEFHNEGASELLLLSVPSERVDREAADLWGQTFEEERNRSTFSVAEPAALNALVDGAGRLLEEVRRDPSGLARPDTITALEQDLLSGLLATLTAPGPTRPDPARRQRARLAADYLREHYNRSVTLGDLCQRVGTCERTLREGFLELYGLPPMQYLKALRLRAARAELRNPRADERISQIAMACGFTHLGRFSVDYRRAFGETPTETRSRSRFRLGVRRPRL